MNLNVSTEDVVELYEILCGLPFERHDPEPRRAVVVERVIDQLLKEIDMEEVGA